MYFRYFLIIIHSFFMCSIVYSFIYFFIVGPLYDRLEERRVDSRVSSEMAVGDSLIEVRASEAAAVEEVVVGVAARLALVAGPSPSRPGIRNGSSESAVTRGA